MAEMEAPERTSSAPTAGESAPPAPSRIRAKLGLVEDLIQQARTLPHDSKAESLVKAVELATQATVAGTRS